MVLCKVAVYGKNVYSAVMHQCIVLYRVGMEWIGKTLNICVFRRALYGGGYGTGTGTDGCNL